MAIYNLEGLLDKYDDEFPQFVFFQRYGINIFYATLMQKYNSFYKNACYFLFNKVFDKQRYTYIPLN